VPYREATLAEIVMADIRHVSKGEE